MRSDHLASLRQLIREGSLRELMGGSEMNFRPTDILNLTADYGAGHRRCSSALEEAFSVVDPSVEVTTLNYIQFVHPLLDSITQSIYVNTVKVAPEVYRRFYYLTKGIDPDSLWQYALNNLGHRKLVRLLQKTDPKIVLCTFPTPAGVVGELKRRGLVSVPQVTVVTDNAVHTQWISRYTDLYIVASDWVKSEMLERHVPEEKIAVTGIPIDLRFGQTFDRDSLKAKYGITDGSPVVLLLGSAYGMSPDAWETAAWLGRYPLDCQIIVVCGHDRHLRVKTEVACKGSRNPVKVLGYVNTMHELMAISDLAVTKAGGLTVSEALAVGVPLVIHRPIPGQEEENARFLLAHDAAEVSYDADTTRETIASLLRSPERLSTMRENAKRIGKPNAALDAARVILERFGSWRR